MRAPARIFRHAGALTFAAALMAGPCACKRSQPAPDAEDAAPPPKLPQGALMEYVQRNGMTGASKGVVAFADGRVERTRSTKPLPPEHVPVARVEKLAADLAATGIYAEKERAAAPIGQVWDAGGSVIVVRDGAGAIRTYEPHHGEKTPDAVDRALDVGRAFADEVDRDHPVPSCTCRPGDPLCACP